MRDLGKAIPMQKNAKCDFADIHVLVLDDDKDAFRDLKRELAALGVREVSLAETPRAALQHLRAGGIDVLLTDIHLPFIKFVRTNRNSPNRRIPIVASTDRLHSDAIQAARDAGINSCLAKPAAAAQLSSHLRDAMRGDRPFIYKRTYSGPDRRHHNSVDFAGPERRGLMGIRTRLENLNRHYRNRSHGQTAAV